MKVLLAVLLLTANTAAQSTPTTPAALPTEARVGYHRASEAGIFLTVRNLDKEKTIKAVVVGIMTADPIRLTVLKQHVHKFSFAILIKPGESRESVVTAQDGLSIKASDLVPARCKEYQASKSDASRFIPTACAQGQDFLVIVLYGIEYTDGSKWVSPSLTRKD